MINPIPFVPTPRLDYTKQYNQVQDTLRLLQLAEQRAELAREAHKLQKMQEAERVLENRKAQELIKDLNLYSHLNQVQAFRDYKYAYWVGTLIDQYI
jgi:predicted nucleotidyltransferase